VRRVCKQGVPASSNSTSHARSSLSCVPLTTPCHAEGRIYEAYQGLERPDVDPDAVDNATYVQNFRDLILKGEPAMDKEHTGNQLYYL
jgi:hypothetical protein